MAYALQAVIGKIEHLLAARPSGVKVVSLPQGMGLIPITTAVRERYGILSLPLADEGQTAVPSGLEDLVRPLLGGGAIAYVEASFHGGDGTQAYILWNTRKEHSMVVHPYAINQALQRLGVVKAGAYDEFDAIDLGRYRRTNEWQRDTIGESAGPAEG